MKMLITLLIAGVFTGNIITTNLLGLEALEKGKEKSLLSQLKSGLIITSLLFVTVLITYPIGKWVISPLDIGFLTALVFLLVVCGILFGVYFAAEKYLPKISKFLKENCDIVAFVPIAFAVSLMSMAEEAVTAYHIALLYAVICGVGYTFVSLILFTVNERLKTAELPASVKGLPTTLIMLSLLSLAFGGFAGI